MRSEGPVDAAGSVWRSSVRFFSKPQHRRQQEKPRQEARPVPSDRGRTAGMVPLNRGPNHAERYHLVSCQRSAASRACFQASPIVNSSIARFVAVAVSGASVRGRAIGRALMRPPVRARLARVFATRLSRLSWRDMGFRDRNYVHDSGRMGNWLILGFLAVATAAAIRASIPGAWWSCRRTCRTTAPRCDGSS